MTSLRRLLEDAQREAFRDKKGRPLKFELRPGLSPQEISEFEAELPKPLPADLRELLSFASGFTIEQTAMPFYTNRAFLVDFTGRDESVGSAQDSLGALPHPAYLAADGAGNGWAVDIDPETGDWGAVFYLCHNPPETSVQSPGLAEFITDPLDLRRPDRPSRIFQVHQGDPALFEDMPDYEFTTAEARALSDADLARFAGGLADNFLIYDLRTRRVGMGFDWSPAASDPNVSPEVLRDGRNLIFAVEQKPVIKRRGFFSRLFGGSR